MVVTQLPYSGKAFANRLKSVRLAEYHLLSGGAAAGNIGPDENRAQRNDNYASPEQ
jgi:hypothetical protein